MLYDTIVDNAKYKLADVGIEVHIDEVPRILQEEELCEAVRVYVGEEEAEEVQRQLIIASMMRG